MNGFYITINLVALLIGIAFLVLFLAGRHVGSLFAKPHIYFPDLKGIVQPDLPIYVRLYPKLLYLALLLLSVAFIDPKFFIENNEFSLKIARKEAPPPKEGIAIYLVLDQSGSMKDSVVVEGVSKGLYATSKIDLVKKLSSEFITGDKTLGFSGRFNDLLGMVFFARGASIVAPLTLDHDSLLRQLEHFREVPSKDQDGTSIGYAIFKTANLIASTKHYREELIAKGESSYLVKNNVIILITDGLQDPNPLDKGKRLRNMDIPEAAAYVKEFGIRLYIVNIDPLLSAEKFAPYQHIMQQAAESTGGKFYPVDLDHQLAQIYREIDQLEKSVLSPSENRDKSNQELYQSFSMAPYLMGIALLLFLIAIALETCFLRRVP